MDKNYKDGIIKLVEDVMNRYLKRNLQSLIDDIGIERKMADVHLSVKKFTNEIMDERDSLDAKTIVVKRSKLTIDDKDCKVLSFSDITAY